MIKNTIPNFSKIKTEKCKKEKDNFKNILEDVLNVRYKELEEIKIEIKNIRKNTTHKKNRLLLEKFIVEIEKEQGIKH